MILSSFGALGIPDREAGKTATSWSHSCLLLYSLSLLGAAGCFLHEANKTCVLVELKHRHYVAALAFIM